MQRIVPIEAATKAQGFIFTSTNGVAQAVRMLNAPSGPAWCVGDRTADMARAAGFDAVSADGNAEDLIALLKSVVPTQPIAHIRGKHARGDIGPRLRQAGIDCEDVVAYTQDPLPLTDEAKDRIEGAEPTIIPLFSPRTTALLLDQATPGPNAHMIAISAAAACGKKIQVVSAPTGKAMFDATVATFRALKP